MNSKSTNYLEKVISELSTAEQAGFAAAQSSAELLEAVYRFNDSQGVGRGMLLAAIGQLEKELNKKEVTKLIFRCGGDYAWGKPAQSFPGRSLF